MSEPNKIRVVASYTTIPTRYDCLKKSIQSMLDQTHKLDAIYLALPKKAARLNKEYPPLPDDLAAMCTVVPVDIDYGPICKVYGALIAESDPNTIIISCDDDVGFTPNFVETILKFHKKSPKSAICGTGALIAKGLALISIVSTVGPQSGWNGFTGFEVPPEGRRVDLIFGVAGVLYTRGMFPPNERLHDEIFHWCLEDDSIFHNDDVLISGYLSKMGIERRIYLGIPEIKHFNGNDALSGDLPKMIIRLHKSINKVIEIGFYPQMEDVAYDETAAGKVAIGIILSIIIIILAIFYFLIIGKETPELYNLTY